MPIHMYNSVRSVCVCVYYNSKSAHIQSYFILYKHTIISFAKYLGMILSEPIHEIAGDFKF